MADDREVKTPISKLAEVTSASEEDIMLLSKKNSSNVLETFKIKVGDFLATALKDYNNINVWMSEKIAELMNYVSEANFLKKNKDIEGGTHTKITYDANGLVTVGSDL